MRRTLDELGTDAMPADIQDFVKRRFDVEISTDVVSTYKGKIARERRKRGRKPKVVETAVAAPAGDSRGGVSFRDLRTLKEISDRIGPAHLRELLELMT